MASKFVEHVLPEPTEGPVPALKKSANRLTDQATKLRAERDQAQATVSAATQQVARHGNRREVSEGNR